MTKKRKAGASPDRDQPMKFKLEHESPPLTEDQRSLLVDVLDSTADTLAKQPDAVFFAQLLRQAAKFCRDRKISISAKGAVDIWLKHSYAESIARFTKKGHGENVRTESLDLGCDQVSESGDS